MHPTDSAAALGLFLALLTSGWALVGSLLGAVAGSDFRLQRSAERAVVAATAFVALATVLSAIYPAWRASRLAPAEAMRFYE